MKKMVNIIILLFSFVIFIGIFKSEVYADTNITIKYQWRQEKASSYGGSLTKFYLHVYEGNTDKKVAFKASIFKNGEDKNLLYGNAKKDKLKSYKTNENGIDGLTHLPNDVNLNIIIEVEGERKQFTTNYKTDATTEKIQTLNIKANIQGEEDYKELAKKFIDQYTQDSQGTNTNNVMFSDENFFSIKQLCDIYAQGDAIKSKEGVTNIQKNKIQKILEKVEEAIKARGYTLNKSSDGKWTATGNGETVSSESSQTLLENATNGNFEEGQTSTNDNENIFQAPSKNDTGGSAGASLDDMIGDADTFVEKGKIEEVYDPTSLQDFSSNIFNIFATVGAAVAIIVGIIIGIKYMIGSIDTRAEVKKMLIPYLVGCLVVFGGFGIWKLVITILSGV